MSKSQLAGAATLWLFAALVSQEALAGGGTQMSAWVSSSGADVATCGTLAAPCRTIQYALANVVEPGGTIMTMDATNYGPVVISHAITIVAEGTLAQILATSGDAVHIQAAASDKVVIRGLSLNGVGSAYNGVNVVSGGQVVVDNCVITGFVYGVNVSPSSGSVVFTVVHSSIVGNSGDGVAATPAGSASVLGAVTSSVVSDDDSGVAAYPQSASATAYIMVSDATIDGNANAGLEAAGIGGSFAVTRTTALANGTGASVYNSVTGVGHGYTYGDNRILKSTSGTDTFGLLPLTGN